MTPDHHDRAGRRAHAGDLASVGGYGERDADGRAPPRRRVPAHAAEGSPSAPLSFLTGHWREGAGGAVRMGLHHGLYCVGCCWALMALLFALGVMNLFWVLALATLVLVEKAAPRMSWITPVVGVSLLGAGLWVLVGGGV